MIRENLMFKEVAKLKERLLMLGGLVERSLRDAVTAVEERDMELAERVIAMDTEIDRMEVDLEEECLKILALHQPVAGDLRFIVTVLKVNNDLERIGDLASSLAEYAEMLLARKDLPFTFDFPAMAAKVEQMLSSSLDALVNASAETAMRVRLDDDIVDDIHRRMYARVEEEMRAHPEHIDVFLKHVGISRCLERTADLTTNICEDVIYLVTGEIVRH